MNELATGPLGVSAQFGAAQREPGWQGGLDRTCQFATIGAFRPGRFIYRASLGSADGGNALAVHNFDGLALERASPPARTPLRAQNANETHGIRQPNLSRGRGFPVGSGLRGRTGDPSRHVLAAPCRIKVMKRVFMGVVPQPTRSYKGANLIRGTSIMSVGDTIDTYLPSESETFMSERQRDYFRAKLLHWKEDILRESRETLAALQMENENHSDIADRASSETDRSIELRARDRQRKLIAKIDAALSRIDDGTYGYCEETGEPISLKRLDARPIATLSIEAQERHERRERVYRDD